MRSIRRHVVAPVLAWVVAAGLPVAGCTESADPARAVPDMASAAAAAPPPAAEPTSRAPVTAVAPEDRPLRDALAALHRGDGAAAVEGLEQVLRTGSETQRASAQSWLPLAYVAKGDPDAAAARAEELCRGASREALLWLLPLRGDIECARGDTDAATALYESLARTMTDEEREDTLAYTALLQVGVKMRLLGRNAPDLTSAWRVGEGPSDIRGRVAMLTYFTPYDPDLGSVAAAKRLRALADPPIVLGVVPTDADEHVPRNDWEFDASEPAKPAKGTQEGTRDAVVAWRRTCGADFPVIGVEPASVPADALLFATRVIVDAAGRVAFVSTGDDPDCCIETAVARRLLAQTRR